MSNFWKGYTYTLAVLLFCLGIWNILIGAAVLGVVQLLAAFLMFTNTYWEKECYKARNERDYYRDIVEELTTYTEDDFE